MADSYRSQTEIQTILGSGGSGEITAQDIRESISSQGMYWAGGTGSTAAGVSSLSLSTSAVQLLSQTGVATYGSAGITLSSGALTVSVNGIYAIDLSCLYGYSNGTSTITTSINKAGTAVASVISNVTTALGASPSLVWAGAINTTDAITFTATGGGSITANTAIHARVTRIA